MAELGKRCGDKPQEIEGDSAGVALQRVVAGSAGAESGVLAYKGALASVADVLVHIANAQHTQKSTLITSHVKQWFCWLWNT
jgi:hypothetical protein